MKRRSPILGLLAATSARALPAAPLSTSFPVKLHPEEFIMAGSIRADRIASNSILAGKINLPRWDPRGPKP